MIWSNSHSLCVSFSLTAYGFKITLDYSFQQNFGLYPWDILSGLAGMLQFCKQDKNCMDTTKKNHKLPQNCTTHSFGKPWCFPMAIYISSTSKTHPEERMHLQEMCKTLTIPFFSRQKSGVPLCGFGNTSGWSAGPPECCCWAQQHCSTHSAVWAPVQRPRGWGSHLYPQLEALTWPVPNGMLEQHTQNWQGANSWHWRNETDSSWASLTCKMVLKGVLEKYHLNRGRKLRLWSCSATFYCYSLLCWEVCPKWLSSKCTLAGAQTHRVHV